MDAYIYEWLINNHTTEEDGTHLWISGELEPNGIAVEFLFDGEIDGPQVSIVTSIIFALAGAKPYKGKKIIVKVLVDFDGCIRVHNLCPTDAVAVSSRIARDWGFVSQYHGGSRRFADTLYIGVSPTAFERVI